MVEVLELPAHQLSSDKILDRRLGLEPLGELLALVLGAHILALLKVHEHIAVLQQVQLVHLLVQGLEVAVRSLLRNLRGETRVLHLRALQVDLVIGEFLLELLKIEVLEGVDRVEVVAAVRDVDELVQDVGEAVNLVVEHDEHDLFLAREAHAQNRVFKGLVSKNTLLLFKLQNLSNWRSVDSFQFALLTVLSQVGVSRTLDRIIDRLLVIVVLIVDIHSIQKNSL